MAYDIRWEFLFLIFLAYFFLPPYSLSLFYFMISCKGALRNGKKYAELAYLLLISENSGVQKQMALLLAEKVCQVTLLAYC